MKIYRVETPQNLALNNFLRNFRKTSTSPFSDDASNDLIISNHPSPPELELRALTWWRLHCTTQGYPLLATWNYFMEKGKTIGGNNFHLNFFKNICCIKILNTICEKMKKKIVTSEKKKHHKIFKKILHALKRDAHFNHNRLIVFV